MRGDGQYRRTFMAKDGGYVKLELNIRTRTAPHWDTLKPVTTQTVSIVGDLYELMAGRIHETAGGQIHDSINPSEYEQSKELRRIIALWKRWHLNDLRAGTKKQMAALKGTPHHDYTIQVAFLKGIQLHKDNGYMYGSNWLIEPTPKKVIKELRTLFRTDNGGTNGTTKRK
jgi:hypothetical protein